MELGRIGAPGPEMGGGAPNSPFGMDAYSEVVRRLRAKERTLRLFVEHTPAAVAMFDLKMRYLAMSRRWLEDYRVQDREIIGRSHYDVFPEIPERWRAIHRRCLAGAVESCEEDRFERADGSIDWVRWRVLPWHDEHDRIGGVIMFTEVVTERKRLEERLRQTEKMEALGQLAGGIAHDFNNLTLVIGACAELVEDGLPPDHPVRPLVADIRRATEHAATLTQRLFAFSRKQPAEAEILDLNRVVVGACTMVERSLGTHVAIETHLAPDLGPVRGDAAQMTQVLLNLVANARDAMPRGGVLTIATENVAAERVPPAGSESPSRRPCVVLSVADTGMGMDEQTRARIFEPFFTTKAPGRGTGFGLAVVHGIVHQHQGTVAVDGAPGRGTTVRVFLPRADEAWTDVGAGIPAVVLRGRPARGRDESRRPTSAAGSAASREGDR
jgi:two-component system cell cycle sensor histidine kinase/response regulator CckA